MRKFFLITTMLLALLTSPLWIAIPKNNVIGYSLERTLRSATLPKYAEILSHTYRVFIGGNGNGCDYQAILVVQHHGKMEDLYDAYLPVLENEKRSDKNGIIPFTEESSTAKIRGQSTELSISPNKSYAGLYLVVMTTIYRRESLDIRCF